MARHGQGSSRRWAGVVAAAALAASAVTGVGLTSALAGAPAGPDVSAWQHARHARIDWRQVARAGQRFTFVKATQGDWYVNPYFASDLAAANAAGLLVGAYHYAEPATSPITQADYFAREIGRPRPGELPPVLDLEESGGLSPGALADWVAAFLARVQIDTGRQPMIYTYPSFWSGAMGNTTRFAGYPLWLADYTRGRPWVPGGWSSYTLWQFTDDARLPGIVGGVDDSRSCCGLAGLATLADVGGYRLFLAHLAQDELGGSIPPATAAGWGARLEAGLVTRAQVADAFAATAVGRARRVGAAYEQVLGRPADAAGEHAWVRALGGGESEEHMVAALAGSPNFFREHGGTDLGFVAAAYQVLLGRRASAQEEVAGLLALQRGTSRTSYAYDLVTSQEGRRHEVGLLYAAVLRRAVDPAGMSASLAFIDRHGIAALRSALFGSSEYLTRIAHD